MAELIRNQYDISSVAIISEETDYAQGLRKVFVDRFQASDGLVVADENFIPGTDDFRSILTKIKAAGPDAIFVNPQTEIAGGTIVRQVRELGIDTLLFGSNILSGSKAIEIAGSTIDGLVLFDNPGLDPSNPIAEHFLNQYQEKYGDLSIEFYLGAGYDAVHILAEAIASAGENARGVHDYMETMPVYDGVIGLYKFDENGDLDGIQHVVKRIEDGEVVTI